MIAFQVTPREVSFRPPVNVIEPSWYAVQTLPRHEKAVVEHLRNENIDCLVPLTVRLHKWSDRNQSVSLPIFPGYAFVRLNDYRYERIRVLRRPGVVRFVGNSQGAIPLEEHEIEHIRQLMENKIHCEPHPYLQAGQKVRIRNGSLRGLQGILLRETGKDSLVLSVSLIQRSLSIRLEGYDLEVL
jgi:transcription termination/antitermination protein NusG